jgi:hypothetical protein
MRLGTRFAAVAAIAIALAGTLPLLAEATPPAKPATPTTAPAPTPPAARAPTTTTSPAAPAAKPPTTAATAAAPAATTAQTISRNDFELVVTLLRNTLIALHQANLTGNYTVLRDLGAPGFRDANSATRLGEIFAPIRARGVDLSRVVLVEPNLTVAKINENGMLNIAGNLAVTPVPVNFEMLYQAVSNNWQLFGISINAEQPQAALTPPAAPAPVAAPAAAPASAARPTPAPTPTPRP